MIVYVDAEKLTEREAAHDYLMEQLLLPDYYGKNLDALFDCLTEMDEMTVRIINQPVEDTYFKRVLAIMSFAAQENPQLRIELID